MTPANSLLCLVLISLLFVACAPNNALTSTPTILPSHTSISSPVVTNTPRITATLEIISSAPLVTAPYIEFASWSPDSQWIAYWVSSRDEVEQPTNFMPGGTLNFMNMTSGETCAADQFLTRHNRSARVHWSDEIEAIIAMGEETFAGRPCQAESYRKISEYLTEAPPNPALSPDGNYHAETLFKSSENGILTFETSITASGSTQPAQSVTWQIDERLGEYGLGGQWISKEQFLLHETLEQGPLIIDVEEGIVAVLTELFSLEEIPSMAGPEEYGLRAMAFPGIERDSFHLLLQGVGVETNFPSIMLYHAENGAVERLPFRHVWGKGFSANAEWLLMDVRPDVGGYETYTISIRPLEEPDEKWQRIAEDINSVLWNPEWTEMAFNNDESVIWQTFPDAEGIGRWDTSPFWTYPVEWSPDGRFLVAIGNIPGSVAYGLFILER